MCDPDLSEGTISSLPMVYCITGIFNVPNENGLRIELSISRCLVGERNHILQKLPVFGHHPLVKIVFDYVDCGHDDCKIATITGKRMPLEQTIKDSLWNLTSHGERQHVKYSDEQCTDQRQSFK